MSTRPHPEKSRTVRNPLALFLSLALALSGMVAMQLGLASPAQAATQTLTYGDGATITYNSEVVAGQPIVLSGTGWVIKPGQENNPAFLEGDEGSIIGVKFMPDSGGTVIRDPKPTNPWNGATDYASPDVWEIIQAAGTGSWWNGKTYGSWDVEIPWPTTQNGAVNAPDLKPGDTFSLQFLGGTLYGNTVCTGGGTCLEERPDISRTINLQFTIVAPAGPLAISKQPETAAVANGAQATFTAESTGGVQPVTVQWQRSTSVSATSVPANFANLTAANTVDGSFEKNTLVVTAGANTNGPNRWYRAVFTDAEGTKVTSDPVRLSVVAVPTVTTQPSGRTISTGETATFTATATSTVDVAVKWQSTRTILANGEPDATTWADISGATDTTLSVQGTDPNAQNGTYYRAVFSNVSGEAASQPAQLRFYEKLDTETPVVVTGESYGPTGTSTNHPQLSAPNAVVKGEDIVIEGFSYLHPDGLQGSVSNVLIDGAYSGDPNIFNTTRTVYNPVTGEVYADKRGHNVVQAGGVGASNVGKQTIVGDNGEAILQSYPDWEPGYFRVVIPWPNETNSNKDKAFFDEKWAVGTQHTVRFLTGSLQTGDYQQGLSVRFTIVDEPTAPSTAPAVTTHPTDAGTAAGGKAVKFTAAATGTPEPSVQWEVSADGTTWSPVAGATSPELTVSPLSVSENGNQYRAVFTNSAGTATSNAATLTVVPAGSVTVASSAELGGTLKVTGQGFIHPAGGGSTIGIKIDAGGYSRLDTSVHRNQTIWAIVEADDDGTFSVDLQLPDGTTSGANGTNPAFTAGNHTLQFLTGGLSAGDASRTIQSSTFTVNNSTPSTPPSGWRVDGGRWFYYGDAGVKVTGWVHLSGAWYYLDPAQGGAMATGWTVVAGKWYYMNSTGAMTTGWVALSGSWYYLNPAQGGAMATGWTPIGGTWYYLKPTGAMTTGWAAIGGTWYYFASSGAMTTGWINLSGTWYYLTSSGAMATGWINLSGTWYLLNTNGAWIG